MILQAIRNTVRSFFQNVFSRSQRDDQTHVMTTEEKVDEAVDESFPASDPPGHFSKSYEDQSQFTEHDARPS